MGKINLLQTCTYFLTTGKTHNFILLNSVLETSILQLLRRLTSVEDAFVSSFNCASSFYLSFSAYKLSLKVRGVALGIKCQNLNKYHDSKATFSNKATHTIKTPCIWKLNMWGGTGHVFCCCMSFNLRAEIKPVFQKILTRLKLKL